MIAGIFHEGSGLGNQLFRYVASRVVAKTKGFNHAIVGVGNFKGGDFMNLYLREAVFDEQPRFFQEKKVVENGVDIRGYDPEVNFIMDNTVMDGEFQDKRYFSNRMHEVREWLKVSPLEMPDDMCVIGFRGGEYKAVPDLFLTKGYWDAAITLMREKYPDIRFEVHTDDVYTATRFFPDFKCVHDTALNWRSVRYARHLIIANSSFFILPALLNQEVQEVIAPRYWARRNTGVWALPQNYYPDFTYL